MTSNIENEYITISRQEYIDLINQINTLTELAFKDKMTGCYNRNYLETFYTDKDEFMCHFCDINNLKKINDTQGHQNGDRLIKSVANKLMSFGDTIRFGGDEFILITDRNFDTTQLQDDRYSIGSKWKGKNDKLKSIFDYADKLMYQDKKQKHKPQVEKMTLKKEM